MGDWYATTSPENKYQYNGKELNEELGLNWNDYGARYYDPSIGRFTGVDPISDQFPHVSTYNYAEKVWSVGTTTDNFTRTSWNQAPLLDFPLATGKLDDTNNNYIYNHETGNTADGNAFNAYIESADIDLDPDGESFMFVNKVIPDIEFLNSSNSNDTINLTLKGRRYPAENRSTLSTIALTPSTQFTSTRGRTRQVSVRIENNGGDFGWRLGDSRFDIKSDGRK